MITINHICNTMANVSITKQNCMNVQMQQIRNSLWTQMVS